MLPPSFSPILFVCAGNLCRSPFAENYCRSRLAGAGIEAECFSRGLIAMPGRHVPDTALKIGKEFDVDLGSHISQPLLAPDLERAAMVLVMEKKQRQHLAKMRPAYIGKVFLLSQSGADIVDPMGQDEDSFRKVYGEIVDELDGWLQRFGVS
ncbi:MAG TPA: hypothetical protein VNI58_07110 [Mariprofundaceae bacterium]|nr:hypothetical protein [Mariprofundaceae bacterium]